MPGVLGVVLGPPSQSVSVVSIGIRPYLAAVVISFLLRVVSTSFRDATSETRRRQLALLTAGFGLLSAIGLSATVQVAGSGSAASADRVAVILALTAGTMAMYGLGMVIDRWGAPAGTGVWFMLAAQFVHRGLLGLGTYLTADHPDATTLLLYGAGSVALLAGLVCLILGFIRIPLERIQRSGRPALDPLLFFVLIGGVTVPVYAGSALVSVPPLLSPIFGVSLKAAEDLWRFDSPVLALAIAFSAVQTALTIGACMFAMRVNVDFHELAVSLRDLHLRVVGLRPGRSVSQYLETRALRANIVGAAALALLVTVPSQAFRLLVSPHLHLGGSEFVFTAAAIVGCVRRRSSGSLG